VETTPDAETTSMVEAAGARVGARPRESVEIHAGVEYREYGLVEGLRARGYEVVIATEAWTFDACR